MNWKTNQPPGHTTSTLIQELKEQHIRFLDHSIPAIKEIARESEDFECRAFLDFLEGMEKEFIEHFRIEEEIIFPVIEIIGPRSANPLAESLGIVCQHIKEDHHVHRRMIADLRGLGTQTPQQHNAALNELCQTFANEMEDHLVRENEYLFRPFISIT